MPPPLRSAGPSWGRSRSRWSSWACSWSWLSWARSTSRGRTSEPERVPHARRAGLRDRPLRRPHAAQRDRDPARDRADAQRREHQPGGLRPLPRRPSGAGLHALHDRDHRRRGRGGTGDRHRDLPRTTDGRGRPPRPAQGLGRAHRRASWRRPRSRGDEHGAPGRAAALRRVRASGGGGTASAARAGGGRGLDRGDRGGLPRSALQLVRVEGRRARADVGLDPGRRGADGDRRRAAGPALERDARAGHARLAPRADLLARVPPRRAGAVARAVLHVPVALRVLDARARPLPVLHPDVRVLGAGGPLLVPPDRVLVRAPVRGARGRQGLLDHQARRPRLRHRDRHALGRDGHVRVPRALRTGPGARAGDRVFEFHALFALAQEHALAIEGLGTIMLLIYLGAVGKSAQFPLHVWLPDAMEGPAPVSALIHAATMVTAGVFMVTRAQPLFVLVPDVLVLIGWVGAFTALLAATLACVESDIKRVLAYSTVSQLGYMMAAVGAGAPDAGFLHSLTTGLFKP